MERTVAHIVPQAGALSEMWLADLTGAQVDWRSVLVSSQAPVDPYEWTTTPVAVAARFDRRLRAARKVEPRFPRAALVLRRSTGRAFESHGAGVVHAHFGTLGSLWAPALQSVQIPLVVSFYGQDASANHLVRDPWSGWYRRMFDLVAAVLVEGPAMAKRVEALGARPESIRVIELPLGLRTLPAASTLGPIAATSRDRPYAVFMGGRFVEKKGFEIGVAAFARAFRGTGERLLIVGGGPSEGSIRKTASKCGILEQVDFRGPLPIPEFADAIQQACVAAFPSVTAHDGEGEGGAPMVLPLAHRMGTRCVVSDHDDLPWAAAEGTPVVPMRDVDALAGALVAEVSSARRSSPGHEDRLLHAAAEIELRHEPQMLARQREELYELAIQART